ncbi:FAD binding domain containing protein [Metarhizium rileyi]|uniref:FAD binding domain containing protein n=1 Tax=Metarhizium rileyi (strain RCEF 4871) TaxID=1649241 RepID=A0A167KCL4_METRR|nr:FAD binding domain containing protein [Metarhizium rileyi RCEF 4871]
MAIGVSTADVCIIGGGPTGLFTGLLLHRLGVSVCIVDGKPGPLELGRADALNARTQQYLEVAKLLDGLLSVGLQCNTSSTFAEGEFKSRQNTWWVGLEHTLHKNFLMVGQPVVEEMLASRMEGLVRFGETVVFLTEDDGGVETVTSSGFKIRSKYAVGSDGARSMVRKQIGATFTGTKPEMLWAVLDTFIETDFPLCPEIITFQLNGQSRVFWIPRERGMCRFYVLLDGEVTQQRAEESIKQHMAPHKVEFKMTEWYSTFDVKERIASTFISKDGSGRIMLAGDAAHVHSVNGGQGLNTGMSDAFHLAWRLAEAVKNPSLRPDAVDKIIGSYDTERRSTARDVIDVAAALVRDTVHTAKQYVGTIEKNAGYITGRRAIGSISPNRDVEKCVLTFGVRKQGMGVTYRDSGSPLVRVSEHGLWKAGNRCPDMILQKADGGETRLYTEATYGRYLVLHIGETSGVDFAFRNIATHWMIQPAATSEERGIEPTGGNGKLDAVKIYTADWASRDDPFVVVVRPDMYLGFVGANVDEAREFLGDLYLDTS